MNANAKLWVEELRSGKYKQGKNHLHCYDTYCCLGVACKLYCEKVKNILIDETDVIKSYDDEDAELPWVVREWLGLSFDSGSFRVSQDNNFKIPESLINKTNNKTCLAQLNDNGLTFDQIADIIEKEPEGLFTKDNQ